MGANEANESAESTFSVMLMGAARMPGVRINRKDYLRSALARHCSEAEIRRAIEENPAAAGIPLEIIDRLANESIRYESGKASALSAAAGLPGLLFLPATASADVAQYLGHMLRIAQKLAYLYSWPDLMAADGDDLDDATKSMLTLLFGVMFGVQVANVGVGKVAAMLAEQAAKQLPRQALTQGVVYPVAKKVAGHLGIKMTKQIFAKSVSKAIPIIGAAVSGGFTLATYYPMAKRLQNHLADLEVARPGPRVIDAEVVD